MIVKTKKYQLDKGKYIKLGLGNVLRKQWWVLLIAIGLAALGFIFPDEKWWFIGFAIGGFLLYLLFWIIQFAGVTQLEQNAIMFEKLSYEIDSRQVMIKLNQRQGSPVKWDMIKDARKGKDYFLLIMSKAQFIHLPFKVFNSERDIKFMETILSRKGLI